MKKRIITLALIGLLATTIITGCARKVEHPAPISSLAEILQAHNIPQSSEVLTAYVAETRKKIYYRVKSGSQLPGFFEYTETISTDGIAYKRDKVDLQSVRKQTDLIVEQEAYHMEIVKGKPSGSGRRLGDTDYRAVKSAILRFGLIPFLRQLQDTTATTVYLEQVEGNQKKLVVKTASEDLTLYVDSQHLIRKIQVPRNHHNLTMEYDDYRTVDGVQLPFSQRIFADEKLVYELFFTQINLTPSFPVDYFSRDALTKQSVW